MMSYKDKCWCMQSTCINFNTCGDALNDLEREKGKKWWGDESFPYSSDDRIPACYEPNKELDDSSRI